MSNSQLGLLKILIKKIPTEHPVIVKNIVKLLILKNTLLIILFDIIQTVFQTSELMHYGFALDKQNKSRIEFDQMPHHYF